MLSKLFNFIKIHQNDAVLVVAIVLITITSYNLGKISVSHNLKTPVTILEPDNSQDQDIVRPDVGEGNSPQFVVASKKSTSKLYHFAWCSGASKITDQNKITFANEQAAITAGYTLAGNCKK